MSPRFKYIIVVIIIMLGVVFLFQLFWLKGLYHSLESQMRQEVINSISQSNLEELDIRMSNLEKSEKDHDGMTINFSSTLNLNKDFEEEECKTKQTTINGTDTTQNELHDELSLKDIDVFMNSFYELIHQNLDTVEFINMDTLIVYTTQSLKKKNLNIPIYKVEVIDLKKDSIIQCKEVLPNETGGDVFDFKYDVQNQLAYRFYTAPLTQNILMQMIGILSTTLLIFLLLIIAFWYLIKTIFNQKTIDQMKDDFTNNMTHELKTPIAVAYAANDALLNFGQADNKEKREKYLQISKLQLEKLSILVEQILSMNMEQRTNMQLNMVELELSEILQFQKEQHLLKATKPTTIDINIDPKYLSLFVDKEHFNNIISNLIDNAMKYSKDKVNIKIKAYQDNDYTAIEICDNGIGIPADKQKYVFDKFYRVSQGNRHDTKGYGIGLFYVKTMIEKHGGVISITSKLGEGTRFLIQLPYKK